MNIEKAKEQVDGMTERPSALITGITGQDGSYLAEWLLELGYQVHGMVRRTSSDNTQRLHDLLPETWRNHRELYLHFGELTDTASLHRLVQQIGPDEVYNLGAQSHVKVSFDEPMYTMDVVAGGTLRLLEAVRALNEKKSVRFYQASSSEMFGKTLESPQNEATPFAPCSPYACAKVFAFHQTVNYRQTYGLFACNGIQFNHESPRRGESFVTRKITRAAGRIRAGLQHDLQLGNLNAFRDWGFAEDYVRAMWLMLQQERPDDYVIATGETHSVRDWLELAFGYLDLDWKDFVQSDPQFLRPAETSAICGDASKAAAKLNWHPTTSFAELVQMMVEYDWQLAQKKPPHRDNAGTLHVEANWRDVARPGVLKYWGLWRCFPI